MNLFELEAVLRLNKSEYDQGIDDAETEGKSFVNRVANTWTSAKSKFQMASTLLKPVTDLIGGVIDQYSEYQQMAGGIEQMFGNTADRIIKNARSAYKTAGISMNNYMSIATSFGQRMLQGLGGDVEATADLMDQAIIQMADNVNAFGGSFESVSAAYMSLSRGNYAMLDNLKLGYSGTKEELDRLMRDAEEFYKLTYGSEIKFDSSNFADVVRAIGLIQERAGISGTTQREAEGTVSGSTASMKAMWDNLQTIMGDPKATPEAIQEATDDFTATLNSWLDNISPIITTAIKSIIKVISHLLKSGEAKDFIGELVKAIVGALPSVITELVGLIRDLLSDKQLIGDIVTVIAYAVVSGLASLIDILLTGLISIFNPDYEMNGTAFSQWGVYDWIDSTFGFGDNQVKQYSGNKFKTYSNERGAVTSTADLGAPATAEGEEVVPIKESTLAGLMELYGFKTAEGDDYLSAWRETMKHDTDEAFERNMKLLGIQDTDVLTADTAAALAALMDSASGFMDAGDSEGLARSLHILQQTVSQINQGWQYSGDANNVDLMGEATILSAENYAEIIARINSVDSAIDEATRARTVSIGFSIDEYTGDSDDGAPHAKGLWDVPYDNYAARLHRDEMVLTASQARDYRNGNGGGFDSERLYQAVAGAVAEAVGAIQINMDSRAVGTAVAGTVSKQIYQDALGRRFA